MTPGDHTMLDTPTKLTATQAGLAVDPKDFGPLADLVPKPNYMAPIWLAGVHHGLSSPQIMAAFEAETGMAYRAPRTPIERAVDEASGYALDVIRAFCQWYTKNYWGEVPEAEWTFVDE